MFYMKPGCLILLSLFVFSCLPDSNYEPASDLKRSEPKIDLKMDSRSNKGFLLGFEPYLTKWDYVSEDTLYAVLKSYFEFAKKEEVFFVDRTIVVLPENIGTWLVFSGEKNAVFSKPTIQSAISELILNNIIRFTWVYSFDSSYAIDKKKETVFRMKSYRMAEYYQNIFSRLASEYRVDIVAGSIVLPEPKVVEGKITITEGPLQNVSFYFHSDGSVDSEISRKQVVSDYEKDFLIGQGRGKNPIYNTPLGLLYIMMYSDAWDKDINLDANSKNFDFLAMPGFLLSKNVSKKSGIPKQTKKNKNESMIIASFNGEIWDIETNDITQLNSKKMSKKIGRITAMGIK